MQDKTKDLVAMYLEVYDTLQEQANELEKVEGFALLVQSFNDAMAELASAVSELDEVTKMEKHNSDLVVTLDDFERVWDARENAGDQANPTIAKVNETLAKIAGIVDLMDGGIEEFAKLSPQFVAAYKAARVVKGKTKDGKGGDATTGK